MAAQSVSPLEADIARSKLAALPPRTLSREAILATPDFRASVRSVRFWDGSLRVWVVMDRDDPAFSDSSDWDGVD
jgi:hypothetical protein